MRWKLGYFFIFFIFMLNLGNLLDVTTTPKKVDILVYLGGGGVERIDKTLELYQKGYVLSNTVIYTGSRYYHESLASREIDPQYSKKTFFIKNGIKKENLIHLFASNTMEEIRSIKKYMLKNRFHSVMFVTDPPHSRRVKILANNILDFSQLNLQVYIVGSDISWWDKDTYFLTKNGLLFVLLETIKIPYNYIAYGILEKYGLLITIKENFGSYFHSIKRFFIDKISREWE